MLPLLKLLWRVVTRVTRRRGRVYTLLMSRLAALLRLWLLPGLPGHRACCRTALVTDCTELVRQALLTLLGAGSSSATHAVLLLAGGDMGVAEKVEKMTRAADVEAGRAVALVVAVAARTEECVLRLMNKSNEVITSLSDRCKAVK